jgi:hypothetical protein
MPQQIDGRVPVGGDGPGEPQLRASISKFVRRLWQMRGVDSEEGIERLDFHVEALHKRNGHTAKFRHAPTDGNLSDGAGIGTNSREEFGQVLREASRNQIARADLAGRMIFAAETPCQLARRNERPVA